jgi:hypothetical protein
MDIFISYRRGKGDQSAGRIHDFLKTLGYSAFYDKDEKSLPTGAQFPETIRSSIELSKVIIAVIGESWIEQTHRLAEEADWVRNELLYAHPQSSRFFLPIYLSTDPKQLAGQLPPELAFIETTSSRFLWSEFEGEQKAVLLEKLRELLPDPKAADPAADAPNLGLLCDRTPEEGHFVDALRWQEQSRRPPGWLLFGEKDQGQHAIVQRILGFTLTQSPHDKRYREKKDINLHLNELFRSSEQAMNAHILRVAGGDMGVPDVRSYAELYQEFTRRKVAFAMLYSLVYVKSKAQTQWWIERFARLQEQLSPIQSNELHVVLVLSISYTERERGFRSLFMQPRDIARFFKQRYPEHFLDDTSIAQAGSNLHWPMITSRLRPAREDHVRDWFTHRLVRNRINGIPKESFLHQFERASELPMDAVIEHLDNVMSEHDESTTRGAAAT